MDVRRTGSGPGPPQASTVVGVGASAGGLKALQDFVSGVPDDSGWAYIVITHLDPDRESRLSELLQDRSDLPVTRIAGPTSIEADHVYVTPADRDLEIRNGAIAVRERSGRAERLPIDLFFRTLADAAGPEAVGVILSGTGHDGSEGIAAIRAGGGITAVQSPDEAEYRSMPESAIATGRIDIVSPAAQIPAALLRVAKHLRRRGLDDGPRDLEAELEPVFALLRSRTGHDFALYKRSTVLRRLDRRLLHHGVDSLAEYVPILRSSREECASLLQDLLISVSAFFRDPDEFQALAKVVPTLFAGKDPGDSVRVWVVGCATGEEAYSIAMLLAEHAAVLDEPPRVQMFATDIDERGYSWGREGLYSAAAVAQIEPGRLERFFTKEPGGYRISKSLRESVLFAVHDVLRDPPFARVDLISCRNLFIYLQPAAQQQALEVFHYALNPEGVLFLGASETAGDGTLFAEAAAGRVFRRNATSHRVLPRLSAADPRPRNEGPGGSRPRPRKSARDPDGSGSFSYGVRHVDMVEQYAGPSLIVDDQGDVLHLSEGAGRFLRHPEGEPGRQFLNLMDGDARTALRGALHRALENGTPTVRNVRMRLEGADRAVRVHVRPGGGEGRDGRLALVVFEEAGGAEESRSEPAPSGPDRGDVKDLESELERTRQELESMGTAYDRTVAHLQTLNDELLSINEEQKAATEELETSREEIQAINEELTTINQEHRSTIEELRRSNADLQNLIESTEIGTVFVDRAMRIRRFTPTATSIFNFASTDHGRPLGDITHRLHYPDIIDDVRGVLTSLQRNEREVASEGGDWFIVRISPYRSHDGELDGAVLTFFDNTAQHRAREQLRKATKAAEEANAAKTTFLSKLSHELQTPLSAMMGYAEILQMREDLTDKGTRWLDSLKEAGQHLASMIKGLLLFVRLDGGVERLELSEVDAGELAREAEALVSPAAQAKGLTTEVDAPADGLALRTDEGKARQILANLCGNAVKYTETGGIRVRVSERRGWAVFEVIDTGIGIASEDHDRVFDRFWQADDGAARKVGGLGIGLSAALEYARLLGGDVELESEPGHGSTFRLWLPAGPEGEADGEERGPPGSVTEMEVP